MRKSIKLFAVIACYLILSISFVSAISISESKHVLFSESLVPKLTLFSFKNIACTESGYKHFSFVVENVLTQFDICLLYTSPSPRD